MVPSPVAQAIAYCLAGDSVPWIVRTSEFLFGQAMTPISSGFQGEAACAGMASARAMNATLRVTFMP